jgi:hypothetical protein
VLGKHRRPVGEDLVATAASIRNKIASVVWLIAVVCALFLAVGALIWALKLNQDNAIVRFVLDVAEYLDFGNFKQFAGKTGEVKEHLVDWGIAAVIYLVAGKILDRIIRP